MRSLLICSILGAGLVWAQHSFADTLDDSIRQSLQHQLNETAKRLERGLPPPEPEVSFGETPEKCEPIAQIKNEAKGAKFTQLNIGQYHVMMGIYLGSAITPEGIPPGDGAMLVQLEKSTGGILFWTKGDKDACEVVLKSVGADHQPHAGYAPLMMPPEILKILKGIAGGKGEIASPAEDDKDELKL